MANSADPDQLASTEANWSGSTLFAKTLSIRVQQDQGQMSEYEAGLHSAVGSTSDCRLQGSQFQIPAWPHNFVEIGHEIISAVILPFPLI